MKKMLSVRREYTDLHTMILHHYIIIIYDKLLFVCNFCRNLQMSTFLYIFTMTLAVHSHFTEGMLFTNKI